jgi:hypothetical protein
MEAAGRECRMISSVPVLMRDGARLFTTVYLPIAEGQYPVVLIRTAYDRSATYDPYFPTNGMGLVVQDCRGRYDSDGEHIPFANEADDGFDTIEWICNQDWCDGHIGMYGDSYLAATQFAAAISGTPHLTALTPRFMSGDCWKRAYYCDGVFSLALTWSWLCFEAAARTSDAQLTDRLNLPDVLRCLPIREMDEISGAGKVPTYRKYVEHSCYDEHWEALSIRDKYDKFQVPSMFVGGWYDNYAADAVKDFLGVRAHAGDDELRDSHRLLIGPWPHGISPDSTLGETDFGADALTENDATYRWLNCMLHGRDASEFMEAPIRIFVMGLNRWRDEYEWPLARTRYVSYFLHDGGVLDTERPISDETPDVYTYDPADPVLTLGGNHSVGPYNPGLYDMARPGPYDQRPNEERDDVLVYRSGVLTDDMEVTGPVVMKLYATSSARDTDFMVKLTDIHPDGRSMNITEGVIRARFREDVMGKPTLIDPGQVYEFTIDMQVTSNLFRKGHRLGVYIMSSNFPLWDRNLNTGNEPGTDTEICVAEQTIFHSAKWQSHIILPVVSP